MARATVEKTITHRTRTLGVAGPDGLVSELDVHGIHVRLGINGDGLDIELAAGADDAEGNFAAIGD